MSRKSERILDSFALKLLKNSVLQPCPKLAQLKAGLGWAELAKLPGDWRIHLQILKLLAGRFDFGLSRELLAAAVSRWTRVDVSSRCGVIVHSARNPHEAVIAWKKKSVTAEREVWLLRNGFKAPARSKSEIHFAYLSHRHSSLQNPEWVSLEQSDGN